MKPEDNSGKSTRLYGMIALLALGVTLAFASYSSLVPSVNAQFGGGRGFGGGQPIATVTGNYTNSDANLQIVLPTNWTGSVFQNQNATVTTVRAVPNDLQQSGQGFRTADSMTIRIVPKSIMQAANNTNSSRPFQFGQGGNFQNRGNFTCTRGTPQSTTINGMDGLVTTAQCSSPNFSFSTKTYAFQTQDKLYTISFMSSSSADSAKYMPAFDSSVGTLKIANTIQAPTVPEFPLATVGIMFAGAIGAFALIMRRVRAGEKQPT